MDSLLERQKSEYFKNIRFSKKTSPKSIEYINLMKEIVKLKNEMEEFKKECALSHHLADKYQNDFLKLENIFLLITLIK